MKVRCHTRRQDSCRLQRFPDSAERTICCEPMPKRERYVWVCTNRRPDGHPKGSCGEKGAEALQRDIKSAVAQAGLHHTVRVCARSCIDLCWKGISVAVMPDKAFLGGTTPEDIPALVEALGKPEPISEHAVLREKLVKPEEFDDPARDVVKLGTRRSE